MIEQKGLKHRKNNPFLEFYEENQISPVAQDISDSILHYQRREKLYRMLGIPSMIFKDKHVLEVAPGSGYNTLAFLKWGAMVDLIEPNSIGRKYMKSLFHTMSIDSNFYCIYDSVVEDFLPNNKYPIIIAEGFIQHLDNQKELVHKLMSMVEDGGIVVITCADNMGFFVEQMKRLIGQIITKDILDVETKTKKLVAIFEPQLKSLEGVSRPAKDWVQDQLISPAGNNNLMSFSEAISYFDDEFDVLGSSQSIFVDYSWYKQTDVDYKKSFHAQYKKKRHNFLLAGLEETLLTEVESDFLSDKIDRIRALAIDYEKQWKDSILNEINYLLHDMLHIADKIDSRVYLFLKETIDILNCVKNENIDFTKYPQFFFAFGRGQQYLSMIKKRKY